MTIVEAKGLVKDYREGRTDVHALRGVDLQIGEGEFIAVAGPSGSGKTTLLNIVSGLDSATAGEVRVDGAVELRKTCKIRAGQRVQCHGVEIRVVPAG